MRFRRIFDIAGLLLLIAVVAPFFVYTVPGAVGADHSFVVLSGSMEPEISPGDVVVVQETDPESIEEGNVITFAEEGEEVPVTHRVIDRQEHNGAVAFETQGDANPEPDASLVPPENVLGSVIFTIPLIGYVIQFGGTPVGLVVLVGLPVALLLVTEAIAFSKSIVASNATTASGNPTPDSGPTQLESDPGSNSADVAGSDEEVTVHVEDLTITLGILVLVVPYSIYVAIQLPTAVSLTAAFAATFSMLGLGSMWLLARYSTELAPPETEAAESDTSVDVEDEAFEWLLSNDRPIASGVDAPDDSEQSDEPTSSGVTSVEGTQTPAGEPEVTGVEGSDVAAAEDDTLATELEADE
ncbi:signal peptidase I [Natrarchaeobaculum sulfurireducens]|uniref:S26 family signal peptidase n=1 Tax=Natrarchaeobaculum sulfurireducens TaxID=2044521 RepID=A0A346P9Z5_9EURY|nr:signal peptidase I [Natrarchaeobaculum sulfurireducens]AXR76340.1 S26 family signal peptidase [Natrarchaeobaculum sulfurireducens]